ncbi:uncharacterized protein LOC120778249 [Bactrocera tryoni]|uniref:uncharacterized protein LOC120778249 n=1 Tax=Bactrocera tryoni TaxID=59916 RepID=UPI001A98C5E9|nr:uncharacterized protein LOC120778249 [Bactrocera tryoni]
MSYQIKSTPFFRRMVSTSKKNGQLQRLKEEYERIKDFNDRTIEMKMRQVRLKRLFREIEEIKETSSQWKRRRVAPMDRLRTNEEIRVETLVKAKELGKEYSKMNALVDRCSSRLDAVASGAAVGSMSSRIELERKARSDKRISYGNDRSRMNIQKISTTQRKSNTKTVISAEQELKELKDRLKNRLQFGNSCSSRNLSRKLKKDGHRKATEGKSLIEFGKLTEHETLQCKIIRDSGGLEMPSMTFNDTSRPTKTFEDMHTSRALGGMSDVSSKNDEDRRIRARQRWRKLALLVRHRFDTFLRRNAPPPLRDNSDTGSEEYSLRAISNDTDLPLSQLRNKASPPNSEAELQPGEVLLSVESLDPIESQPLPDPGSLTAGNSLSIYDESSNATEDRRKVQTYVKILEPFLRDAGKKAVELSVEEFRSIFEHRSAE